MRQAFIQTYKNGNITSLMGLYYFTRKGVTSVGYESIAALVESEKSEPVAGVEQIHLTAKQSDKIKTGTKKRKAVTDDTESSDTVS